MKPLTTPGSLSAPLCPSCSSHTPMVPSSPDHRDSYLDDWVKWRCPHCTHTGVTARRGIELVFRGGTEYVFASGPTTEGLTVSLSSEAIALFKSHSIGADDLARRAAEWMLLRGATSGIVRLDVKAVELGDFYWYFYCSQASGSPVPRLK